MEEMEIKNICSSCGVENLVGKDHNNPWACITALKHKNFELQKQLEVERQARFDWLNSYIWDIQATQKFDRLTRAVAFQFGYLRDSIEWMGDLDKVEQKAKELISTVKELMREVGL